MTDMTWARYARNGYEVSTKGDDRFSALKAKLSDGRTIEEAYQLDIKGYRRLGYTPFQAKRDRGANAPVKLSKRQLWEAYLSLWEQWSEENPALIEELRTKSKGKVLTDMFATGEISQARALAEILSK